MSDIHRGEVLPSTVEILKALAEENRDSLDAEHVNSLNKEADRLRCVMDFKAKVRLRKLRMAIDLEALLREEREKREKRGDLTGMAF